MTATTSVNPDGVVLSARNLLLQFGGIVAGDQGLQRGRQL